MRPRPTWTEERLRELAKLLLDGLSFGRAAKRLGVARGSVSWATARYGIGREADPNAQPTGPRVHDDSWDRKLVQRWADRKVA